MKLFLLLSLLVTGTNLVSAARRGPQLHGRNVPYVVKHGMFAGGLGGQSNSHATNVPIYRRQASTSGGCDPEGQITIKAPKTNIFAGLTNDESVAVTAFLHEQESLNLTAAANATR